MTRCSALRLLATAAAAALIPALSGCAAGVNAQITQPFTPTDGASAVFHDINIRDAFVLGPGVNATLEPGQAAGMFLALVNQGVPDQLIAISAPGTAASVTIQGGTVDLPSAQPALLTGPAPQVVLNGLARPLTGGEYILIELTFRDAGTVAMIIPVMPRVGYYATFSPPPPSPTPTPTPTTRASNGARPSLSAGAPGTATPTPTPSP